MEDLKVHALDAQFFLELCQREFAWGDLSRDVVMDIGCGIEKNCCETMVRLFPKVKKVIAIDNNRLIIRKIGAKNKIPQIQYSIADIEDSSTLTSWENVLTKVVSCHCIHQLGSKELGFRNIHRLLKHGGEAGFFFCLQSGLYEWGKELYENPKWKQYYTRDQQYPTNLYPKTTTVDTYKEMLERIGFTVVYCKEEPRVFPYPTEAACHDNLKAFGASSFTVPDELMEDFKAESFEVYLKHNMRNDEGKICYSTTDIAVLVKKPYAAASE